VQSASLAQLVLQAVAPQAKAAHAVVAPGRQVPFPSQVRAAVAVAALHVAGAHTVLVPYLRQAPEPSQVPSVPQAVTETESHWFSGS